MIIQIDMPLHGTYYEDTKRGEPTDAVHPLPLPFGISYHSTLIDLDVEQGTGRYEITIDDADLNPGLRTAIQAFAKLTPIAKRAQIPQKDTFYRKKEHDNRQ